jgi:hypothetical protein
MSTEVVRLTTAAAPQDQLRAWARAYRVRWEITRHFEMVRDCKTPMGFDLTLISARPVGCNGDPACGECARAHEGLARLASSVLPPGTLHDVSPFDGSFHLGDQEEPELLLTVEIFPEAVERDVAERSVRAVLAQVENGLRRLGILPERPSAGVGRLGA